MADENWLLRKNLIATSCSIICSQNKLGHESKKNCSEQIELKSYFLMRIADTMSREGKTGHT